MRAVSLPSRLLAALILSGVLMASAQAQPSGRGPREGAAEAGPAARPATQPPALPPLSITHHSVTLPDGTTLKFTATAGALRTVDAQGAPQYDLAYISYALDDADPRTRPVAVAFNGGPGAASAWLQLGALGPWRLPMSGDANAPSAPPVVVPNAETWLRFTDLVFLDPVGTGYSRFLSQSEDLRKQVWSVGGDVDVMAAAIRRWVAQSGRAVSPKYIVGESYGGVRGPRVVRALQTEQGIGVAGLVLVSPVIDMAARTQALDPLGWATRLPTMTAIARAATAPPDQPIDRAALADVESYAIGDYLRDLLRGDSDRDAVGRMVARVTTLTGLDPELVRARGGRVDTTTFTRELHRAQGQTISDYDGSVTAPDPFPDSFFSNHDDAVTDSLNAPVTSAMLDLYGRELKWLPDLPYRLLNIQAARQWDFGRQRPESATALRVSLALDPHFRVLIGHGLFDLVTPYFATQLILNQFPPDLGKRVRLIVMPGGHMFYTRDASRQTLRDAAAPMFAE
jgi:carboxypeptidase C (cathepsin A)